MSAIEFYPAERPESPFSGAVRVGDIVYLSGQIGSGPDGKLAEGLEAQTRQTMDNIVRVLTPLGLSLNDVFKCTIMLADMNTWREFNRVYLEYFKPEKRPSRSAFGTAGLVGGALMEIECWAYAPSLPPK